MKHLYALVGLAALAVGCATTSVAGSGDEASVAITPESERVFSNIAPSTQAFDPARVTVEQGVLVGENIGDVAVFRGVPYAAPPVGENRWAPPQAAQAWVGDRAAVAFEPACPQPLAASHDVPNQGGVRGTTSEDCLYLQVFAPTDARGAPVMVWLHGGAMFLGAGHLGSYDGTSHAEKGVVTVSLNYRLGQLGTFAHPAITAEGEVTGSYALMDVVAALEWVRDNIAAFGGDPSNVTLAGQSAGGFIVVNLLATPSAEGLFHKAVVQSGARLTDGWALEDAESKTIEGVAGLGVTPDVTAEQLRAISPLTFAYSEHMRRGLGLVRDGDFVPTSPKDVHASGEAHPVPVLVGSNGGEGGFAAATTLAAHVTDGGAEAFLYRFNHVSDFRKDEWPDGAIHSAELMFTFDSLETSSWAMGQTNATDDAVADQVSSCWVAFYKMDVGAKDLTCADGFTWPAYDTEDETVATFEETVGLSNAGAFPDGPE